ncbi:mitochondrial ribonuclease P catalytic subunit [Helicoverpa armigera]|uniref:mitochondrial ribonuclease P catalytic subunit n=1 Tax=Helicoverpa armigera TaxID=29058 RepID=UPI0030836BDC
MLNSLTRLIYPRTSIIRVSARVFSQNASFHREKFVDQQIEYIKTSLANKAQDWTIVKNDVLSKEGNATQKNIDAIMLKFMVSLKQYVAALSFADHLRSTNEELSLGTMKGLLNLYYEIGKTEKLSKEQAKFILDAHKSLLEKYKVLDYSSSETLLHALCVINEWEKALKLLADIHLTTTPTHSAYSTLIATLFGLNKKKKALELVEESLKHKRPLLDIAYEAWMDYILRKYKDKKVIAKHLEELFSHVATNCTVIPMNTANKLKELYSSMQWNAKFTKIRKLDGQCQCCKDTLDCLPLSEEEFNLLQKNVKEKLIVGSDLFLKTSPEELKRFLDFVDKTAPYDIVLDGLNIAYAVGAGTQTDKAKFLIDVVDHFVRQKKKILLLGRQHMLRWNKRVMQDIKHKTSFFLTDNISQDDPYFITAAIISGPQTDIVSKDLLRGHKFLLQDDSLRLLFKRWQWQHQWMVFIKSFKGVSIQEPLKFTPCAQKKNGTWHLPFEREASTTGQFNDGTPDLYSWICLRHK